MARPSKYDPSFAEQAAKLCRLGATDKDLADFFGVSESTLNLWKTEHPELSESLKEAKAAADAQVERRLYERACGYSHPAIKIFCNKDTGVTEVSYTEHYPPDTTAAIFWLKNRKPSEWRDVRDVNITRTAVKELDDATLHAIASREGDTGEASGAAQPDRVH